MADQEELFAQEAQEQVLLSEGSSDADNKSKVRLHTHEQNDSDDENSPLIGTRLRRPARRLSSRAGYSYNRLINEPWTSTDKAGPLPWYKRPSIYLLLPGFFPFCLAFGGIIVPKQYLVLDLICRDYLSDRATHDPNFHFAPVILGETNEQCRIPEVQSLVAKFNLYQNLLSGLFAAIVAPQLGSISDRYGRKPLMIYGSIGAFVMEIITIIVGTHPETISVYWILIGSLLDGLCGSFTAGMALSFAYASDCTAPEVRNTAFGYFHGALFLGVAFGPLMSGGLISATGNIMIAFYVALGCHVFFFLYIIFVVPESLSKERQMMHREKHEIERLEHAKDSWTTSIKAYNIFEPLWVLRPTGPGSSKALRRNLLLVAGIDTMMFGVAMGTMNIMLIYAQYRFGWNAEAASVYLAAVNICRSLGLVLLLPFLTRMFRGPVPPGSQGHKGSDKLDVNIIRGSIVFDLVGYLGFALTPSGAIMVLAGLIASLGGIGSPTLQSSLTKHIPAQRTGQVLGASALLHALARVVAPTVFNLIYSQTVKIYAGIVFLCLASVFVVVFVMSWFVKTDGEFDLFIIGIPLVLWLVGCSCVGWLVLPDVGVWFLPHIGSC
jgi:MFS family permease